ncbi:(2Fe-2S) ferredoxin domain-containing protein [Anaeromicropila herbilytica]|uniref:NADH dehydrogenase n=1 Tax=Anaeromicropila herbilytica TaxID=2785025 RepID=A0A7R7EMP6_9FIRM|nr:(2Fe-2S) ferredoxin domain-containing protein [Anaeromicropila herbilytica]BCN31400.1 NADH dehydrogenase [Anaeromicropila herbilytica]
MFITICVGSSCHLKGSRQIIESLESLIKEHHLEDDIELNGSFCMGECMKGVCVTMNGTLYSLKPDNVEEFFNKEVLGGLR